MNSKTLLLAITITVGVPSLAYLVSTRYKVAVPNGDLAIIYVVDGWTGRARIVAGSDH